MPLRRIDPRLRRSAGDFPVEKIITARIAAENVVEEGFETLLDPSGEHLKTLVRV